MRRFTLIAGPTASGKSALAIALARSKGAHVVNADSMQVYDGLRVLTARPTDDDLGQAPHHLFGHVPPSVAYSTGQWARDVEALLDATDSSRPMIFVGGTGLYFRALTHGLSPIPKVDPQVRAHWRNALADGSAAALHAMLAARDPQAAQALEPNDSQRILRALEVLDSSGRSILWWQGQPARALVEPASIADRLLVLPDRAELHQRIEARFDAMIQAGALDEVARLKAMALDPSLPAMKAIGVRELMAVLDGGTSADDAIERAKAATRQYAKRQMTWWRGAARTGWAVIARPELTHP